jgi:hypothetical protein
MTVQFAAQQASSPGYSSVVAKVTMVFRECRDGEVLVNNQCEECPSGSYSLHYDPMATCISCPPNTDDCSGNSISVSSGYWRLSPYSTVMLECPMPDACVGGDGSNGDSTGSGSRRFLESSSFDSLCAAGYTGPLCAVCSHGYYLDTIRQVRLIRSI